MLDTPKIQLETEVLLLGQEYTITMQATDHLLIGVQVRTINLEEYIHSGLHRRIDQENRQSKKIQYLSYYVANRTLKNKLECTIHLIIKVLYEILTYQDLENLKQQKAQSDLNRSHGSGQQAKINKRYLILSYQTDFEKIHYPLALNFDEQIENSRLMTKIQNMKTELLDYKQQKNSEDGDFQSSNSFSRSKRDIHTADSVINQNELLKAKIKRLEESLTQKRGAVEVDQLIRDNEELQKQLNTSKSFYEDKLLKMEQQLNQKNSEIVMQMAEINAFKQELTQLIGKVEVDTRIKEHIKHMNDEEERQVLKASKVIAKQEKEIEGLNQQIDFLKKQDTIQKKRINQLEAELSQSMKKFNYKGVTDRLYSPYSNHSNGSRKSNYSVPNRLNSNHSSGNASPNVRNASPAMSKNSRSSTQNSAAYQRPKFYNTSPVNKQQQIQRKVSPARPIQQKPTTTRISPAPQQRQSPQKGNIFKQPSPPRQNYLQQKVPTQQVKTRTNQSANNYKQPIHHHQYEKKSSNVTDLDNKINNLKNMLQRAKR